MIFNEKSMGKHTMKNMEKWLSLAFFTDRKNKNTTMALIVYRVIREIQRN